MSQSRSVRFPGLVPNPKSEPLKKYIENDKGIKVVFDTRN
jgi:hypothetical protein